MKLVEEMYKYVTKKVLGAMKFKSHGFEIDMSEKFKKIDYVSEIKRQTGVDVLKASEEEIKKKLDNLKAEYNPDLEKPRLIDVLWKECRKKIIGPAFLINHPVEVSPLAKKNSKNELLTERYNVIIAGSEIGNGYSELNDPQDQEQRFKIQAEMREKGDEEAQMCDKEFVEALKYGMPPTTGFGVSERFFAFLVDKPVRECVLFPFMRPEK
jgi:lysyl-tRNA synthetase class 2